ncbi:toxin-antitoxin system HicB family antitoxin [Candidatus Dojkabacteria bacterium]|nr:toxin-antitoxin system HicB family antitoxin [Candidatus Dojkabacteria bacterium]
MVRKKAELDSRMIHIRVSEEMHKKLRIGAAEKDTSMQNLVTDILEKAFSKGKK